MRRHWAVAGAIVVALTIVAVFALSHLRTQQLVPVESVTGAQADVVRHESAPAVERTLDAPAAQRLATVIDELPEFRGRYNCGPELIGHYESINFTVPGHSILAQIADGGCLDVVLTLDGRPLSTLNDSGRLAQDAILRAVGLPLGYGN